MAKSSLPYQKIVTVSAGSGRVTEHLEEYLNDYVVDKIVPLGVLTSAANDFTQPREYVMFAVHLIKMA